MALIGGLLVEFFDLVTQPLLGRNDSIDQSTKLRQDLGEPAETKGKPPLQRTARHAKSTINNKDVHLDASAGRPSVAAGSNSRTAGIEARRSARRNRDLSELTMSRFRSLLRDSSVWAFFRRSSVSLGNSNARGASRPIKTTRDASKPVQPIERGRERTVRTSGAVDPPRDRTRPSVPETPQRIEPRRGPQFLKKQTRVCARNTRGNKTTSRTKLLFARRNERHLTSWRSVELSAKV